MAVFIAMLKPGDTVMGMNLDHSGHRHTEALSISPVYISTLCRMVSMTWRD